VTLLANLTGRECESGAAMSALGACSESPRAPKASSKRETQNGTFWRAATSRCGKVYAPEALSQTTLTQVPRLNLIVLTLWWGRISIVQGRTSFIKHSRVIDRGAISWTKESACGPLTGAW
jgi:hypothetical protein